MADKKGPEGGKPHGLDPEVGPPAPLAPKRGLQPRKQRPGIETRKKFKLPRRPRP